MNKGFFVVFLGVVLGAMALIFVNQTTTPTPVAPDTRQSAPAAAGTGAPATEPVTVASRPESAKPDPVKPEPTIPEPAKPEPVKPEPVTPEPAKPEPVKPEPVTPEPAKLEPVKSEPVKPEPEKPDPTKPEPAPPTTMTPVTSTPETPAKPGGASKSLALVNIGMHFKGKGMALRIEANAPFSYKIFALPAPDRYVIDLVGAWSNMRAPTVPSNNMVKGARIGQQTGGPRLVLDMQRAPKKHNVTWISRTVLEILIE